MTMVDHRTNSSKEIINFIQEIYSHEINVFKNIIPAYVTASDMIIKGESRDQIRGYVNLK